MSKNFMTYFPLILFSLFGLMWIIVTYKIGDWRNWRKYYHTILFFWCGDLIYNVLFYKNPLWVYTNPAFNHQFTDLLCAFVIFTCTILNYIPRFPKTLKKQVLYVGFWVFLYSFIEWIFVMVGGIDHRNGWHIGWSVLHNVYQFVLLRIHQDRPILAWILAFIILFIVAEIFNVSLLKV